MVRIKPKKTVIDFLLVILYQLKILQLIFYILGKLEKEKDVVILTYHRIIGKDQNNAPFTKHFGIETPVEKFEKQIRYLSKHYKIISFEKFTQQVKLKKKFEEKTIVISFDDSYKDNYKYGYPILKRYKVPAIFFIITDALEKIDFIWNDKLNIIQSFYQKKELVNKIGEYLPDNLKKKFHQSLKEEEIKIFFKDKIDKRNRDYILNEIFNDLNINNQKLSPQHLYISWEELNKMSNDGMLVGSHSSSHSDLNNLDLNEIEKEIAGSKRSIEKQLGTKTKHFSFPFGNSNIPAIRLLKKNGFESACILSQGEEDIHEKLFSIKRILISNQSKGRFILEFNGGIKHSISNLIKLKKKYKRLIK